MYHKGSTGSPQAVPNCVNRRWLIDECDVVIVARLLLEDPRESGSTASKISCDKRNVTEEEAGFDATIAAKRVP